MNPLLMQLFPTVIELLQEASKTEAGKNVMERGKKMVQVALPSINSFSSLAISFLSTDVTSTDNTKNASVLTRRLDILDNGLSLPASFQKNQSIKMPQKISNDLDILKGQNEILFLSNSIQYFVDSHKSRVGIDRNISFALQYDIEAVVRYLKKNNEIRFPGYLLHQLMGLAKTVEELNIFYDSILNDGNVQDFSNEDDHKEAYFDTVGIEGKKYSFGYIPHNLQLKFKKDEIKVIPQKDSGFLSSVKGLVSSKETEEYINGEAHETLYILKAELESNEELEKLIIKKLKSKGQPITLITQE